MKKKVVRIGYGRYGHVYCEITLRNDPCEEHETLSIHGVMGPKQNGDATGGCGQIRDRLGDSIGTFADGWNKDMLVLFVAIWRRWHLNDMHPGSPAQEFAVSAWKVTHGDKYDYKKVCAYLESVGLLIDDGYRYGTQWKSEPVPKWVIEWLWALPDTDQQPAWV